MTIFKYWLVFIIFACAQAAVAEDLLAIYEQALEAEMFQMLARDAAASSVRDEGINSGPLRTVPKFTHAHAHTYKREYHY